MQEASDWTTRNGHFAGRNKNIQRNRQPYHTPTNLFPPQVSFRIVCHVSLVGGVIGHNGDIISQLRRETSTKINCLESSNSSEHWVILIVGSALVNKRIVLSRSRRNGGDEDGLTVQDDVSSAQEAMVKVFERVWAVQEEVSGKDVEKAVYCGILAHKKQVAAVMGKGGYILENMRKETGAKIRILLPPSCGAEEDQLIQITGRPLAVKKALVAVSKCLQDFPVTVSTSVEDHRPSPVAVSTSVHDYPPPPERYATQVIRSVETAANRAFEDPHAEFFPHLRSMRATMSVSSSDTAANNSLLSRDAKEDLHYTQRTKQEVVFKMLCSHQEAGSIIGHKGAIVRALQSETGASVRIAPPASGFGDRIVTVSAFEDLQSQHSPAQNALILLLARSVESNEKMFQEGTNVDNTISARLIIASNMVYSMTSYEGPNLLEVIEGTGADVHINPFWGYSEKEVLIEITGHYEGVENALIKVTGSIRNKLRRFRIDEDKIGGDLLSTEFQWLQATDGESSEHGNSDYFSQNDGLDELESRRIHNECSKMTYSSSQQSSRQLLVSDQETKLEQRIDRLHLSNISKNSSLGSQLRKKNAVRNAMIEIPIGKDDFAAVYGENGENMDRLIEITGADIEVRKPCAVQPDGLVIVYGTQDQIETAQSLVDYFIGGGYF